MITQIRPVAASAALASIGTVRTVRVAGAAVVAVVILEMWAAEAGCTVRAAQQEDLSPAGPGTQVVLAHRELLSSFTLPY